MCREGRTLKGPHRMEVIRRMWRIGYALALAWLALSGNTARAEGEGEGEAPLLCDATHSAELSLASPRFNRVAADVFSVSPSCDLAAFDSGYDDTAYEVHPFYSATGGAFTAHLDPNGTTMQDSVLYLYCAPFDAEQPGKNLVAYNDDFQGTLLSGFGPNLEITLVPKYTYYLVIATFNRISVPIEETEEPFNPDLGSYTLCLGPGFSFGEFTPDGEQTDPLECALTSGYSQPVDTTFSATAYPSNGISGREVFELITGVDDPIAAIRWWGITGNEFNVSCPPDQLTYRVAFFEKSGLIPGASIEESTISPTITDTGSTLFGLPLYVYDLALPDPVTLPNNEGFVSVYVADTSGSCRFSWASSPTGIGGSLYFNFGTLSYQNNSDNVALCLSTQPDCPGETPETADTLRVQLIDPVLSSVVGDATLTLNRLPNFSYPGIYDPVGGLFRVECLPFGTYTAVVDAPGYAPLETELTFQDPGAFETLFLQTPEGEGEGEGGGCKGCGFLTTVFVTVLNSDTEKGLTNAHVSIVGTLLDITENVNGVYVLPTLSDGTYVLQIESEGFVTEQEVISVADETVLGVTVYLNPLEPAPVFDHTADESGDGQISLGELLGIIQLYNFGRYHCEGEGFAGGNGATDCAPHSCDYLAPAPNFVISLSELLRGIQIYTAQAYYACPSGEDGYCLGEP